MKTTRSSKKYLLLLPCMALAPAAAAASPARADAPAAAPRKSEAPTRATLLADASRMTRLFLETMNALPPEQARSSMRLDLGDASQYQFVLHRVLAAGHTPENNPRLFQSLEKARALARAGATSSTQECSQLITLEEGNPPGAVRFTSSALVSCFGNDGYLYSDLQAHQANAQYVNHTLLDRRVSEEHGPQVGATDRASLELTYRYEKDQLLQLDSLVLGFDARTGAALASYATVASSGYPEQTVYGVDSSMAIYHPVDVVNNVSEVVLRMCLNRNTNTSYSRDCDYAMVVSTASGLRQYPLNGNTTTSPPPTGIAGADALATQSSGAWVANGGAYFTPAAAFDMSRVYVPLQGHYSAGTDANNNACTITSFDANYTRATLHSMQGDTTYCGYATGTLLGTVSLMDAGVISGATSTPVYKLLDFGTICVGYEKPVRLTVQIGARATCGTTTNVVRYRTTSISPIQFRTQ
ncbi:MAG TPA: hypothetical protein VEU33_52590 [Archangium sp.]|nr:hypothetical protein [Archangium sp.]